MQRECLPFPTSSGVSRDTELTDASAKACEVPLPLPRALAKGTAELLWKPQLFLPPALRLLPPTGALVRGGGSSPRPLPCQAQAIFTTLWLAHGSHQITDCGAAESQKPPQEGQRPPYSAELLTESMRERFPIGQSPH